MSHELQLHDNASFLTLTYDDEHLPSDLGLQKQDPTKFLKRLRKEVGQFRYYLVGEYGDENKRPHYHAIIYGLRFDDRYEWMRRNGYPVYRSDLLESKWTAGYSSVQNVDSGCIRYVARYVHKKLGVSHDYQRVDTSTGECWEVPPEYAVMSRRPGLAHDWFEQYWSDVYPSDFVVLEGRKYRPPLYYDRQLEKLDPDLHERVRTARRERERTEQEKADNRTGRLAVREMCHEQRERGYERPL